MFCRPLVVILHPTAIWIINIIIILFFVVPTSAPWLHIICLEFCRLHVQLFVVFFFLSVPAFVSIFCHECNFFCRMCKLWNVTWNYCSMLHLSLPASIRLWAWDLYYSIHVELFWQRLSYQSVKSYATMLIV